MKPHTIPNDDPSWVRYLGPSLVGCLAGSVTGCCVLGIVALGPAFFLTLIGLPIGFIYAAPVNFGCLPLNYYLTQGSRHTKYALFMVGGISGSLSPTLCDLIYRAIRGEGVMFNHGGVSGLAIPISAAGAIAGLVSAQVYFRLACSKAPTATPVSN